MTGLELAQAMLAQGGQPPIGKTLDFACIEVSDGRAVFEGAPGPETYNPMGTVHGGYAATLLDSACGIATVTKLRQGQSMTTLELKVAYHRAMTADTGTVRAEGVVIAMGRRVAFVEAKLTDSAGKLLASASSTLLVITP
ncbi:PaaI family thioesterase [Sphingomonas sp. GlSt437]|uniref:PaaI family thioesterase n=1 Tax=Sphingomonas sp. GlSt437 TaxID=3389970 RepID=UPI003A841A3F